MTGKQTFFYQSENGSYEYLENQFSKSVAVLGSSRKKLQDAQLVGSNTKELSKKVISAEWIMKGLSRKRRELLHNSNSSAKIAKMIKAKLLENKNNKVLMFSKLTSQIDKITDNVYHSGSIDDKIVDKLNKGIIRDVGVCEKLNRGANLVGVNNIILESYLGSETDFLQRS